MNPHLAISSILGHHSWTIALSIKSSPRLSPRRVQSRWWPNGDFMVELRRTGIEDDSLQKLPIPMMNPMVWLVTNLSCSSSVHLDNGVEDPPYSIIVMNFIKDSETIGFFDVSQRAECCCPRRVAWTHQLYLILLINTVEALSSQLMINGRTRIKMGLSWPFWNGTEVTVWQQRTILPRCTFCSGLNVLYNESK